MAFRPITRPSPSRYRREGLGTHRPAPVSRVKCYVITGTAGSIRYTAEQLFTWGSQRFQVGADYPVTVDGKTLKVRITDKKGHEVPERLDVVSVEEVDSTRKP